MRTLTKLYVVDDDQGFLQLVAEVAGPIGFETVVVAGPAAFKPLYGGEPDAVIMLDMIMPEMDGIELVNWLGQRGAAGALILVSGYADQYTLVASALAEAKGLKVTDRLAKPIRVARLRQALALAKEVASGGA